MIYPSSDEFNIEQLSLSEDDKNFQEYLKYLQEVTALSFSRPHIFQHLFSPPLTEEQLEELLSFFKVNK